MALYLGGSEKIKISHDNTLIRFNIFTETPITNGVLLLTSDEFIIKDSDGIYMTAKESEE